MGIDTGRQISQEIFWKTPRMTQSQDAFKCRHLKDSPHVIPGFINNQVIREKRKYYIVFAVCDTCQNYSKEAICVRKTCGTFQLKPSKYQFPSASFWAVSVKNKTNKNFPLMFQLRGTGKKIVISLKHMKMYHEYEEGQEK